MGLLFIASDFPSVILKALLVFMACDVPDALPRGGRVVFLQLSPRH